MQQNTIHGHPPRLAREEQSSIYIIWIILFICSDIHQVDTGCYKAVHEQMSAGKGRNHNKKQLEAKFKKKKNKKKKLDVNATKQRIFLDRLTIKNSLYWEKNLKRPNKQLIKRLYWKVEVLWDLPNSTSCHHNLVFKCISVKVM